MDKPKDKYRFYQKSKLLPAPPEADAIYQYGETELWLLGERYEFPTGVRTPHEIFHLFTMELSRAYSFPEYPFFSHADEITSDYLEEIFALAEPNLDKLVFDLPSIDRPVCRILDCTIVFLQLEPHHAEISRRIGELIPPYHRWHDSHSPLLSDLRAYSYSGILTPQLEWIEAEYLRPRGDTWAKYFMAAHYTKQMFTLMLRRRDVQIEDDKLILTVHDDADYLYEMYVLVQKYRGAFDLRVKRSTDYVEFYF